MLREVRWSLRILGLGLQRLGEWLWTAGAGVRAFGKLVDPFAPVTCKCGNSVKFGHGHSPHRIGTVWDKKGEMMLFCDGSEKGKADV